MDIRIEAKGHPNQDQLNAYYTEKLNQKYGKYPFVKTIHVKVDTKDQSAEVSLLMQLEKGGKIFAQASSTNEHSSLTSAIKKINSQIEKYKQKHYA